MIKIKDEKEHTWLIDYHRVIALRELVVGSLATCLTNYVTVYLEGGTEFQVEGDLDSVYKRIFAEKIAQEEAERALLDSSLFGSIFHPKNESTTTR